MSRSKMRMTVAALGVMAMAGMAHSQEMFDQAVPPNNWNPTQYPSVWPRAGAFTRPTLLGVAGVPGAPAAIATGGDREGQYSNAGAMAVEAYALMPVGVAANVVLDSQASAFVHLCPAVGTVDRTTVGLAARVTLVAGAGPSNAYAAVLSVQPGSTIVWLRLVKDLNGCLDCAPVNNIIDTADTLVGPINVGSTATNYELTLSVTTVGGTAQLLATAQPYIIGPAGNFVPDPAVPVPYAAAAADAAPLAAGYSGMIAFAPNGNKAMWDDVMIVLLGGDNPNPRYASLVRTPEPTDFDGFIDLLGAALSSEVDINGDGKADSDDVVSLFNTYFNGR